MFFKQTKKRAQTGPTPRVFEIPEILDRIFFFIQDDHVLSHSIILVCRQWLWMNQHRLRREVSWDGDSNNKSSSDMTNINKVLSQLPRATHLVWTSADDVLKDQHAQRMIQALRENNDHYIQCLQPNVANNVVVVSNTSNTNSKSNRIIGRWMNGLLKPNNKAPLSKGVLRELDLRGPAALFLRALPYLTSLTTLRLRLFWRETIQVHSVLNTCPHLLTLHLDAPSVIYLPGSWKPSTGTVLGVEPINQNGLLPLQSFFLENASFAQTSLEDLLVLTPHLANLQLRNLRPDTTSVHNNSYSWSSLFLQLTALSLPLRSIHFSVYGQTATEDEEQEKVLIVCPRSSEWAFRSFDLTPSITSCLSQLRNTLTTLELVASEGQAVNNYDLALHRYLCASPHLLHLKAAKSISLVERMDIHNRWTPSIRVNNGSIVQDLRPGVWACRNLQTLHIRVHNLGSVALQTLPIRSRIVFGYISTVLPQLRHLELFELENDPGLSINLFGGLCLLARLRYLESFRLGTGKTPQKVRAGDVRWMIPSGQSRVGRMERMEVVATWTILLTSERDAERSRQETLPSYASIDDSHPYTEPQVVEGLIMLGLLADVKVLVDQMNSREGYRSWPRLKYLSVYQKHPSRTITCLEKGFDRLMKGNTMDIDSRVFDETGLIMGYGA
ncbi:hypothetical protein K457DRAFT_128979 [Linnemannia elongata AG-77]|uniref:F-box domain-containing protein n=1 Tax=Linnemannia elongata AG-77 TaxID=1314771 RepID=A0A197JK85_9FUNG|nr:hypothetical protein K457DRAFT_128979 [Linnemannia elongata AG-77]